MHGNVFEWCHDLVRRGACRRHGSTGTLRRLGPGVPGRDLVHARRALPVRVPVASDPSSETTTMGFRVAAVPSGE